MTHLSQSESNQLISSAQQIQHTAGAVVLNNADTGNADNVDITNYGCDADATPVINDTMCLHAHILHIL